ncbi:class I SAM-dependent methyltransferase [Scytonema sp. NUACC26]|uniref:class I SAM-dependent methyltransferase n=1 Tax=Scytonema sp. NUACC26 TaxID=3140176 RepID=UPI0034DBFEDD
MIDQTLEYRQKIRQHFNQLPYPNAPLEQSPKRNLNLLYVYNLVTPFYLRNQEIIDSEGKLILDAGCGTGYTSLALAEANPEAKIIGIDLSEESVKIAGQRLKYHGWENTEFYTLSIEDLPKLGIEFDYINCDETLYLLPDAVLGLQVMKSVLKPGGIIHTNLHSSRQRFYYYQAQELFQMMGFLDAPPQQFEAELVRETMRALKDDVILKQRAWDGTFDESPNLALLNHLLQGDKGYTVKEMFSALEASELEFISMVEWRHWELIDLFKERDDLPAFLAMSLPDLSIEQQLHLFELLHPTHRLIDFWCGHPNDTKLFVPVCEWTFTDWQRARVHLHPQLRKRHIQEALINCIAEKRLWSIGSYINLPARGTVEIDSAMAACLLPLWEEEQPFTSLVERWLLTRPLDVITLEPKSYEEAFHEIRELLCKLEVFLYVLLERCL